jgi:nitroimidazol reductase NimA-like FMN-containing flavoprotein (pyridoxamine 5'-phosphate oxidase superfamily)
MCPDECRRLLGTKQVGRLAFVSNGNPDVQPVNYALDGDTVVFATGTGTKLWAATRAPVAFEVDDIDSSTRSGWSVVIHGLAQEITALDTTAVRERMEALPLSPWPGGGRTTIVRLPATSITGRRVGERAAV